MLAILCKYLFLSCMQVLLTINTHSACFEFTRGGRAHIHTLTTFAHLQVSSCIPRARLTPANIYQTPKHSQVYRPPPSRLVLTVCLLRTPKHWHSFRPTPHARGLGFLLTFSEGLFPPLANVRGDTPTHTPVLP